MCNAQTTPPGFWNGVNWTALVKIIRFFAIYQEFFSLTIWLDWRALVEFCIPIIGKQIYFFSGTIFFLQTFQIFWGEKTFCYIFGFFDIFWIFGFSMDWLNFSWFFFILISYFLFNFFCIFEIFWFFLCFWCFFGFFEFFSKSLRLLLIVTEVATEHQKWP